MELIVTLGDLKERLKGVGVEVAFSLSKSRGSEQWLAGARATMERDGTKMWTHVEHRDVNPENAILGAVRKIDTATWHKHVSRRSRSGAQ